MINFTKKITSLLFKNKKNKTTETEIDPNYFDISISLDKNFNINILIYLDDKNILSMSESETALVYHEFLDNCFTDNVKKTIADILNRDVLDDNNKNLINKLIALITYKQYISEDTVFIKPSQVFSKYLPDAQ